MTFLLSEDKALREKLAGMYVTDQKATNDGVPRSVGVWFGQPDQEIRSQSYPYATIEMVDIQRDGLREMRGLVSPDYLKPDDLGINQDFVIDMPIPVNIDYQITTYARHPRHDREILAQLIGVVLPIRSGILLVDDGTQRRLDVLDISKRDVTEQAKRLFVNAVTVRVSSEIAQTEFTRVYKVLQVNLYPPIASRAGGRGKDPHFQGVSFTISR
jgi:hypothetical protein